MAKPDQNLVNHLKKKVKQSPPTVVNFILDKSGSMSSMTTEVIDGFNEYIASLKKEKNVLFSFTLFDSDDIEKRYIAEPLANVLPLTRDTYVPGAMTPLYDAVYETLKEAAKKLDQQYKKYSSVVVIMTDGGENSSRHSLQDFLDIKKELEGKGNWTFVFMGANQDAWDTARQFGFSQGNTVTWNATAGGAGGAMRGLAQATAAYAMMASAAPINGSGGGQVKGINTNKFFDDEVKLKIENSK